MNTLPSDPLARSSAQPRLLRAGSLSLFFDGGDLRYVNLGGIEVIRRIYAAVRDHNWGTVPSEISEGRFAISDLGFHISYVSTHRQGEVHFVWRADIRGEADGSIRFVFEGEAKSTFRRNRIGFCVLHPIRECAGAACRARYANGTERELRFPDTIAAEQPVKWLHDLAGLAHAVAPGVWAELEFAGDLFEMEDQRNWIDASFKTYCTPLRLPFPMEIQAGTRVRQEVRLRLVDRARPAPGGAAGAGSGSAAGSSNGTVRRSHAREELTAIVRMSGDVTRLPALGLGLASHAHALHPDEVRRLRTLHPAHVRVDVRPWEGNWPQQLERAAREAGQLGARLEVALHLDATPEDGLSPVADALARRRDRLARVLVFHRHQKSTTPAALRTARAALKAALSGVALGAGTDADLYQLNLQRPPADADFICWSMNPQVHAFDDTSIAETPEAAAHQVASVRRYFPGKPLVVSPVTLRPRFNPNATGPAPAVPPGDLPPQVDPRQLSLFGAAWTLAMLKALAESGADSVTFYETTGWRGVMETMAGSPIPEKFPSVPGAVFPLYHVLADVGEFAGGEVLATASSVPLQVTALALRDGARQAVLLANLGPESRQVRLEDVSGSVGVKLLSPTEIHAATRDPENYRVAPDLGLCSFGISPQLQLPPYAYARVVIAG